MYGNGYWEIPIDKVEAFGTDGKSVASVCGPDSEVKDCRATFDTGAAVIGGPSYLIDPIASKLGASKYDENLNDYVIDCDDQTLGNMEFTFGKFKVVMTPGDYIWKDGVSTIDKNERNFEILNLIIIFHFLRIHAL